MEDVIVSALVSVGLAGMAVVLVLMCAFGRKKPAQKQQKTDPATCPDDIPDDVVVDEEGGITNTAFSLTDDPYHTIDLSDADIKTVSSGSSSGGDSAIGRSPDNSGHSINVKANVKPPLSSPPSSARLFEDNQDVVVEMEEPQVVAADDDPEPVYEMIAFEYDGGVNHHPSPDEVTSSLRHLECDAGGSADPYTQAYEPVEAGGRQWSAASVEEEEEEEVEREEEKEETPEIQANVDPNPNSSHKPLPPDGGGGGGGITDRKAWGALKGVLKREFSGVFKKNKGGGSGVEAKTRESGSGVAVTPETSDVLTKNNAEGESGSSDGVVTPETIDVLTQNQQESSGVFTENTQEEDSSMAVTPHEDVVVISSDALAANDPDVEGGEEEPLYSPVYEPVYEPVEEPVYESAYVDCLSSTDSTSDSRKDPPGMALKMMHPSLLRATSFQSAAAVVAAAVAAKTRKASGAMVPGGDNQGWNATSAGSGSPPSVAATAAAAAAAAARSRIASGAKVPDSTNQGGNAKSSGSGLTASAAATAAATAAVRSRNASGSMVASSNTGKDATTATANAAVPRGCPPPEEDAGHGDHWSAIKSRVNAMKKLRSVSSAADMYPKGATAPMRAKPGLLLLQQSSLQQNVTPPGFQSAFLHGKGKPLGIRASPSFKKKIRRFSEDTELAGPEEAAASPGGEGEEGASKATDVVVVLVPEDCGGDSQQDCPLSARSNASGLDTPRSGLKPKIPPKPPRNKAKEKEKGKGKGKGSFFSRIGKAKAKA